MKKQGQLWGAWGSDANGANLRLKRESFKYVFYPQTCPSKEDFADYLAQQSLNQKEIRKGRKQSGTGGNQERKRLLNLELRKSGKEKIMYL